MSKLLIIEDDNDLREGLSFSFQGEGYTVTAVSTGREALICMKQSVFDVILLDCNLPDLSGFDLAERIRKFSRIPMLMLTARDSEIDEIKALELGIDDYMSKPFSLAVLKVRLRKIQSMGKKTILTSNGIVVDLGRCQVKKDGSEILLSAVEYKLLVYLMENKGQVLSKEQILQNIWEEAGNFVDDNIVSVNIRRLRLKLEQEPSKPAFIKTVHGLGYVWRE